MAKSIKKINLFEMTGEFDKDADSWRAEVKLTPDGLNVLNHFLVVSKTSEYATGCMDECEDERGRDMTVADRYCCRRSFFGLDGVGNPDEYLYLFDKAAVDSGSDVRKRWFSTFEQMKYHGEKLHSLFQRMTLESCIASKKYSVKCHAEVED